ncbi:MAG: acetyl-CoA carboxylase biotin carboxyl carrier protein subunit [Chloroflexi bacterium]|jgi:acetyl-CoA carboxylase biotin carboxyl carrier protein|nr:acetyl-CoA carboxylase biotin carboxyl carrier protein subunit [Chloroflexota bacterium]
MNDARVSAMTGNGEIPSTAGVRALAELCMQAGVEEIQASDGAWSVRLRLDTSALQTGEACAQVTELAEPEGPYVFLSQWVGVFHRSAEAGMAQYVEEGQSVGESDIVGVIAAMQLQHEVRVDRAGILQRFLVQDGTAVEFGQPLLEIS